jgi:hypothetical protein
MISAVITSGSPEKPVNTNLPSGLRPFSASPTALHEFYVASMMPKPPDCFNASPPSTTESSPILLATSSLSFECVMTVIGNHEDSEY